MKRPSIRNKWAYILLILLVILGGAYTFYTLNSRENLSSTDSDAGLISTANSYRTDRCSFLYKTQELGNLKKNLLFYDNSQNYFTQTNPKGNIVFKRASLAATENTGKFLTRMPFNSYTYPTVVFSINNLTIPAATPTYKSLVYYTFHSKVKNTWVRTTFESIWDTSLSKSRYYVRMDRHDKATNKYVYVKKYETLSNQLDFFTFSIDSKDAYFIYKVPGKTSVSYKAVGYGSPVEDTFVNFSLKSTVAVASNTKNITFKGMSFGNCN